MRRIYPMQGITSPKIEYIRKICVRLTNLCRTHTSLKHKSRRLKTGACDSHHPYPFFVRVNGWNHYFLKPDFKKIK